MFEYTIKIDEKLQKEINASMWVRSLIFLIVGAIGLCLYIVISMFYEHLLMEILLWVFAFSFAIGMSFLISINKTNKRIVKSNISSKIILEKEFAVIISQKGGEEFATSKTYYKDLIKTKETENYLLLYINKNSVIPIPKKEFSQEELKEIKLLINENKTANL